MGELWASGDSALWEQLLESSYTRVEQLNRPGLLELERWWTGELVEDIGKRDVKHVTAAELRKLMQWKLKRGKWRPQLQAFVDALPSAAVVDASTAAFQALGGGADSQDALKAAVNAVTVLKGVGPATASAVLAAGDAAVPFMSDEALAVLKVARRRARRRGPKAYTLEKFLELAAALQAKASQLSTPGRAWTAKDVERALFSAAAARMPPCAAQAGGKRKR